MWLQDIIADVTRLNAYDFEVYKDSLINRAIVVLCTSDSMAIV